VTDFYRRNKTGKLTMLSDRYFIGCFSVKPSTKVHSSASTVVNYGIEAHTGFSAPEMPFSTMAMLQPLNIQIALSEKFINNIYALGFHFFALHCINNVTLNL
jgi:hypothetical protein